MPDHAQNQANRRETPHWRDRAITAAVTLCAAGIVGLVPLAGALRWPRFLWGLSLALLVIGATVGAQVWVRYSLGRQVERMASTAFWAGWSQGITDRDEEGEVLRLPTSRRPRGA